ncbi:uncharacterized protein V1510DRAFT_426775 [Dipodascopsis tothii]|uniref:uncharacterized protein n=1 Tax=Dipodascopsis tothii TaxID=44089 RepID=UPI0034CF46A3
MQAVTELYSRLVGPRQALGNNSAFAGLLRRLSQTPLGYEDGELLDECLEILPLDRFYSEAEANAQNDESWGLQDHVVRSMMKWFKEEFFEWVNAPKCSVCSSATTPMGATTATAEERRDGAGNVELYKCQGCGRFERFPRYGKLRTLLKSRRGRCGEWAQCFGLLCRALGSRVRWIWNREDHVWTEVYSEKQARWIHLDSCENAWDQPTLYEEGWGKRMSYAIAFSSTGAVDVSARYIRNRDKALARDQISEASLVSTLAEITTDLRAAVPEDERKVLMEMDAKEQVELLNYGLFKETTTAVGPRESGSAEWKHSRGEDGSSR